MLTAKVIADARMFCLTKNIMVKDEDAISLDKEGTPLTEGFCFFFDEKQDKAFAHFALNIEQSLKFMQQWRAALSAWENRGDLSKVVDESCIVDVVAVAEEPKEQAPDVAIVETPADTSETQQPQPKRTRRKAAKEPSNASMRDKFDLFQQLFTQEGNGADEDCRADLEALAKRVAALEKKRPTVLEIRIADAPAVKMEGVRHEMFESVLKRVANGINVFLTGPAGCGKSHLCKQVADALGLGFFFQNAVQSPWEVTGFIDAGGVYHDTEFHKAFTNGGVFLLDEVDASSPDVLTILNAALANKMFPFPDNAEPTMMHKDFHCIAAGNTFGTGADVQYVGRNQLDAATLDRFDAVSMDYSKAIENELVSNKELLDFVREWRKACARNKVNHICSTRAILDMDKLHAIGIKPEEYILSRLIKNMRYADLSGVAARVIDKLGYESTYGAALTEAMKVCKKGGCDE